MHVTYFGNCKEYTWSFHIVVSSKNYYKNVSIIKQKQRCLIRCTDLLFYHDHWPAKEGKEWGDHFQAAGTMKD
jgi:hypothetical protein